MLLKINAKSNCLVIWKLHVTECKLRASGHNVPMCFRQLVQRSHLPKLITRQSRSLQSNWESVPRYAGFKYFSQALFLVFKVRLPSTTPRRAFKETLSKSVCCWPQFVWAIASLASVSVAVRNKHFFLSTWWEDTSSELVCLKHTKDFTILPKRNGHFFCFCVIYWNNTMKFSSLQVATNWVL